MLKHEDFMEVKQKVMSPESIYIWPLYVIIGTTAGEIYKIAPRNRPRKIEYIMDKLIVRLQSHPKVSVTGDTGCEKWYSFDMSLEDIRIILNEVLMGIHEFRELNLSDNEYQKEVDVDSPNREGYVFVTAYDVYPEDHWKEDFVDVDACVNNIVCALRNWKIIDLCFDSPSGLKEKAKGIIRDLKDRYLRRGIGTAKVPEPISVSNSKDEE